MKIDIEQYIAHLDKVKTALAESDFDKVIKALEGLGCFLKWQYYKNIFSKKELSVPDFDTWIEEYQQPSFIEIMEQLGITAVGSYWSIVLGKCQKKSQYYLSELIKVFPQYEKQFSTAISNLLTLFLINPEYYSDMTDNKSLEEYILLGVCQTIFSQEIDRLDDKPELAEILILLNKLGMGIRKLDFLDAIEQLQVAHYSSTYFPRIKLAIDDLISDLEIDSCHKTKFEMKRIGLFLKNITRALNLIKLEEDVTPRDPEEYSHHEKLKEIVMQTCNSENLITAYYYQMLKQIENRAAMPGKATIFATPSLLQKDSTPKKNIEDLIHLADTLLSRKKRLSPKDKDNLLVIKESLLSVSALLHKLSLSATKQL